MFLTEWQHQGDTEAMKPSPPRWCTSPPPVTPRLSVEHNSAAVGNMV